MQLSAAVETDKNCSSSLLLFSATVFLSAFLLFQVQPVIGKCILPWFGSSPGVWTTCLLFFQMLLLGGYAYAHFIASRLSGRRQAVVHVLLLGVALLALPITPNASLRPLNGDAPIARILAVLGLSVGVPYLILSATGPLLQNWYARLAPGRSPYRLYALSNVGSLLALLSYPFGFERFMRLRAQTTAWSIAYGLFALLCAACAWRFFRRSPPADASWREAAANALPDAHPAPAPQRIPRPGAGEALIWLLLSACGAGLLLATTNQICLDLAVVPFLWVLPLGLYLLTFIFAFDSGRWYVRPLFGALLPVTLINIVRVVRKGVDLGVVDQILGYSLVLLVFCMCCHGELARLKPHPRHLTFFFLVVSIGGALGGLFVAVLAPALFSGFYEYDLLLVFGCLLLLLVVLDPAFRRRDGRSPGRLGKAASGLGWLLCAAVIVHGVRPFFDQDNENQVAKARNFYGVLTIQQHAADGPMHDWTLKHGRISHGLQLQGHRDWPTSYYGPRSGVGLAVRLHPKHDALGRQFRIGVVGLGTGTVAAYANALITPTAAGDTYALPLTRAPPDYVRYYEINPLVLEWASERFSFLGDARQRGADVDVFMGDARIVMERQIGRGDNQAFDVLAIDAFTGDAIPIHLLTRESMAVYWKHLKPDGILAVHVSNRFIDLAPVVRRLGEDLGRGVVRLENQEDEEHGERSSVWVIVTANRAFLRNKEVRRCETPLPPAGPLWTDDFSSVFALIKCSVDASDEEAED